MFGYFFLGMRDVGFYFIWDNEINLMVMGYIVDYVVSGDVIFLVVGYMDMMFVVGLEYFG